MGFPIRVRCHQDINNHDIDYVELVSPGLIRGMISIIFGMSMGKNDIKCEYMFIFPLKNLARKELKDACHFLSDSSWMQNPIAISLYLPERDVFMITKIKYLVLFLFLSKQGNVLLYCFVDDIWLRCPGLLVHAAINLSHCYHIFPWSCVWDVCYIIFCHELHIHSGRTGILFSSLLCSLWWVQKVGYVMACRSYSFVCTLHHLIIIIVQTYL